MTVAWLPRLDEGPVAWLRRLICRCPEPGRTIQNTGYSGTFGGMEFHTFEVPVDLMPYVEPAVDRAVRQALRAEGPHTAPERHLRLVEPAE